MPERAQILPQQSVNCDGAACVCLASPFDARRRSLMTALMRTAGRPARTAPVVAMTPPSCRRMKLVLLVRGSVVPPATSE
jgi:hypothetical protein